MAQPIVITGSLFIAAMDRGGCYLIIAAMIKEVVMSEVRISQIQKAVLSCLAKAFTKGVKEGKSTVINQAVNHLLQKDIHPNN